MIAVFSLKLHHLTNLTHPALSSKCSSDYEFLNNWFHLATKVPLRTVHVNGAGIFFLGFYATGFQVLELFLQNGFFRQTKYNPLIFCSQAILRRKRILFLIMKFCLTQKSRTEPKNGPKHAAVTISFSRSEGVKRGLILTDSTPISYIGADQVLSHQTRGRRAAPMSSSDMSGCGGPERNSRHTLRFQFAC